MPEDASWGTRQPPTTGLHVAYQTVEELFGTDYAFYLPWFQRAYAWGEEHAHRFLADVARAYLDGRPRYVLGDIVLAQHAGERRQTIVDGQQRCFTLTILFALLRARAPDPALAARVARLISVPWDDDPFGSYRLAPQPSIAAFFAEAVQAENAIAASVDDIAASEVEGNIIQNRIRLGQVLDEFEAEGGDLAGLIEFLLSRCLVVLHVVEDEDEAWEMLRTKKATGLAFHDAARLKVTLIEAMPSGEREAASLLWDQCLSDLGNDDMSDLIVHLRDLAGRQRSSQPVEKDILTRYRLDKRGLDFICRDLLPAARNLLALKTADLGLEQERPEIRRAIRYMEWTGNTHWCVPALRWLERRGPDDAETGEFLRLLSRKMCLLRVCAVDAVEYRRRCIALATEIADGRAVADMGELHVPRQTRQRAYNNLTSRTFYDKRYCRALLRYLSDLLGEDPSAIDGDGVTVEHVLPRKPRKSSRWSKDFPTANDIKSHANCLGNLVFLSYVDNQALANQDYEFKRNALRGSGFRLSVDAADEPAWTPEVINRRTTQLAGLVFSHWGLATARR